MPGAQGESRERSRQDVRDEREESQTSDDLDEQYRGACEVLTDGQRGPTDDSEGLRDEPRDRKDGLRAQTGESQVSTGESRGLRVALPVRVFQAYYHCPDGHLFRHRDAAERDLQRVGDSTSHRFGRGAIRQSTNLIRLCRDGFVH